MSLNKDSFVISRFLGFLGTFIYCTSTIGVVLNNPGIFLEFLIVFVFYEEIERIYSVATAKLVQASDRRKKG